ncbi:hypothetical protein [Adlercreutzia muris]|jgi:hypothetical protein|uniref:hypothetical protein n=1 Tax=Adlercreutzia muris TaxID=1796610 RepID=UPI0013666F32|nr:hypothetical protein [Adlercreutzia muris]MCI9673112.1 hypothetical protein [Enterorhabdus sp.]
MDSSRSLKASLRGTRCAVIGVACALMVLEIQRMPVGHAVSFSMFAPVPYVFEAILIGTVGMALARGRRHGAALGAVRAVTAAGPRGCRCPWPGRRCGLPWSICAPWWGIASS